MSSDQCPSKCEQLDDDIDELAKQIRLTNDKKMVQLKNISKKQNVRPVRRETIPTEIKSEDWTSIQGKFGWAEIANTTIPYILRSEEKYVSLRMAESKILAKYKNMFTDEVRSCYSVKIFHATAAEAQLLNEINFRHCDTYYGRLEFTVSDFIISFADLVELYEFLNFCYLRLVERVTVPQNRCGFIKIASQNSVPYVWYESKQYVPLFYFEGECSYLEENSIKLCGWELVYLRLYCKIQGIRKTLFDNNSINAVELGLVKKFFPPDTVFEESWSAEYNINNLVQKTVPKVIFSQTAINTNKVYSNQYHLDNSKKKLICIEKKSSNSKVSEASVVYQLTSKLVEANNHQRLIPYIKPAVMSAPVSNPLQTVAIPKNSETSISSNMSAPSSPPMAVPNTIYSIPDMVNYQMTFINSIAASLPSSSNYTVSSVIRPLTQASNVPDLKKVLQIPEVVCKNAYYVLRIQVGGKRLEYCINMEPYITTILLVPLEEISTFFELPLESIINAVNVMEIDIFLPNKMQRKEFEKFNIRSVKGLVKVTDFIENHLQLKYILTSKK